MSAEKKKASELPKALSGLGSWRDRLTQKLPRFANAAALEDEAEKLCHKVRAQLRNARKAQNIDQSELGNRIDLGQPAISKIENGTGDLGLKTVFRCAYALNMRPVVILVPRATALAEPSSGQEAALAAIEDIESDLIRRMSDDVSAAMGNLIDKVVVEK